MNMMTWEKLWTINKRIIDPVAPRHTAVAAERVLLTLTNGPAAPEVVIVPKHKKNPAVGDKATTKSSTLWVDTVDAATVAEGEEVTLMDWARPPRAPLATRPATRPYAPAERAAPRLRARRATRSSAASAATRRGA